MGAPTKTLLLLTPPKGPCSVEDVLALHLRPPGHHLLLRAEETLDAHGVLLHHHPDYQQGKEAAQIYMEDALTNLLGHLDFYGILEVMGAGAVGQAGDPGYGETGSVHIGRGEKDYFHGGWECRLASLL